jgi:hypothetical protein
MMSAETIHQMNQERAIEAAAEDLKPFTYATDAEVDERVPVPIPLHRGLPPRGVGPGRYPLQCGRRFP